MSSEQGVSSQRPLSRARRFRVWILAPLLWFIGGAAISYAVAVVASHQEIAPVYQHGPTGLDEPWGVAFGLEIRIALFLPNAFGSEWPTTPDVPGSPHWVLWPKSLQSFGKIPDEVRSGTISSKRAGWPWYCFRETELRWLATSIPSYEKRMSVGSAETELAFFGRPFRLLTSPILGGLLANSLFYGFVLFILCKAYGNWRRRYLCERAARAYASGLCPNCRYELGRSPPMKCPECGTDLEQYEEDRKSECAAHE